MRRRDFISALAVAPLSVSRFEQLTAQQESLLLNRRVSLNELRAERDNTPIAPLTAPVTVLHFWGDACPPCVIEMPTWRHIWGVLRNRTDLRVVFLGETHSEQGFRRFLAANERKLPDCEQFLIPYGDAASHLPGQRSQIRARLENDVQPLTLLMDREHTVRQAFVGSIQNRLSELQDGWTRLLRSLQGQPAFLAQTVPALSSIVPWAQREQAPTAEVRQLELSLLHHRLPTGDAGPEVRLLYPRDQRSHGDESWLRSLAAQRKYSKLRVQSVPWVGPVPGLLFLDADQTVRQAFLGITHRTRAPEALAALDRFINVL